MLYLNNLSIFKNNFINKKTYKLKWIFLYKLIKNKYLKYKFKFKT